MTSDAERALMWFMVVVAFAAALALGAVHGIWWPWWSSWALFVAAVLETWRARWWRKRKWRKAMLGWQAYAHRNCR